MFGPMERNGAYTAKTMVGSRNLSRRVFLWERKEAVLWRKGGKKKMTPKNFSIEWIRQVALSSSFALGLTTAGLIATTPHSVIRRLRSLGFCGLR